MKRKNGEKTGEKNNTKLQRLPGILILQNSVCPWGNITRHQAHDLACSLTPLSCGKKNNSRCVPLINVRHQLGFHGKTIPQISESRDLLHIRPETVARNRRQRAVSGVLANRRRAMGRLHILPGGSGSVVPLRRTAASRDLSRVGWKFSKGGKG